MSGRRKRNNTQTAAGNVAANVRELAGGMAVNAVLTVCKFSIGAVTHCAALTADGFKDLADAVRSGLKLGLRRLHRSGRRPGRSGRVQEIAALAVFLAISCMGAAALVGSVRDALNQHDTSYTPALFIITTASVVIKAYMAYHKCRLGHAERNERLIHDGRWAAVDSLAAAMILAAGVIDHILHVDIDPWVGAGIGILTVLFGLLAVWRRHRPSDPA